MKLFNVKESADILAISPWTVRLLIRDGKLRPVRVGRLVRLDEKELEKFISVAKGTGDGSELKENEIG